MKIKIADNQPSWDTLDTQQLKALAEMLKRLSHGGMPGVFTEHERKTFAQSAEALESASHFPG